MLQEFIQEQMERVERSPHAGMIGADARRKLESQLIQSANRIAESTLTQYVAREAAASNPFALTLPEMITDAEKQRALEAIEKKIASGALSFPKTLTRVLEQRLRMLTDAFLKEHGCEATLEEVKAFLEAKQNEDAPLSLGELKNVAGGCDTTGETIASVLSAGLMCATIAITSAATKGSHVGQRNENEGRLCNKD
jgi:hypothetical protein